MKYNRFISVVICVLLALSMLSFNVFADDSSPIQIRYQIQNLDGTWDDTIYTRPLTQGFFVNSGVRGIRIVGFYLRPVSFNAQEDWLVTFRMTGYAYGDEQFSISIPTSSHTFVGTSNPSTIKYFIARQYYSGRPTDILQAEYSNTNLIPSGNSTTIQLQFSFNSFNDNTHENYAQITLASPISLPNNKNFAYWPYFYDIYTENSSQLQYNFYQNGVNFFASTYNTLNSILQSVSGFGGLFNQSRSFVRITYNEETEQLEQETVTGNYWEALLGSIMSLSADSQAQIDQQEKAEQAGALDALDKGYDSADFWSFLDIFDLGDSWDYDDDVLEDVGAEGPLAWFSNECKNSLDSTVKTRDPNEIYIDFYEMNMDEILDILSGNRAERNGYK